MGIEDRLQDEAECTNEFIDEMGVYNRHLPDMSEYGMR